MSYFDTVVITLACGECGAEFEKELGRLKTEPDQVCASCGHKNEVDSVRLNHDLKVVDDWIRNPWVNTQR
jgi:DNA-directed RNA polymerase subunit RPC12/RpoP